MYSILAAAVAAGIAFAIVALTMSPVAAVFPAVVAFGVVAIVLLRRAVNGTQEMMLPLQSLMQAGKVEETEALLLNVQSTWGKWMPMLHGQVEAQRGMLDYVRMQWNDALPKLEAGQWRNWIAQGCIGCIHYRKGDKDKAFELFAKAAKTGSKEPLAHILRAVMLNKDGRRDDALNALGEATTALPGNKQIADLQARIANKKRVDTVRFGQGWYQFWPEELATRMRAQQGGSPFGAGFAGPRMSKRERRGR